MYNEVDEYAAKINSAKKQLKNLQAKGSKLEQQLAEEKLNRQASKDSIQSNTNQQSQISNVSKQVTKNNTEKEPPNRQVSKDSIQSNTSQQSQKSNASKQATNIHTEKEPPNRQASVESLTNAARQKSQTQNLPKETKNELYRELSELRREEGAIEKKLTEISEEISKVQPFVTEFLTDHAKLEQLQKKIEATSKWSGLRNLWRRIIGKESKDEKIGKYQATEEQLKENIADNKSRLEEMTFKLRELKAERSQLSSSLIKIKVKAAVNVAKQSEHSNKKHKRTSEQSLNIG